jgi:hypothetical protein
MNIKTQFKVCLFSLVGLLSVAATIKISDMVTATSVGNADLFTIVQGGTNKKVTQATLLTNTFANVTGGSGINVTNLGTNIVIAASGSSGSSYITPLAYTLTTISNSTVETDVLSVTITNNTLTTGKKLRVRLWGDMLRNGGGNITNIVKLGSTRMYQDSAGQPTATAIERIAWIELVVKAVSNTSQELRMFVTYGNAGSADIGTGDSTLGSLARVNTFSGTASENMTSGNKTFAFAVNFSAADANLYWEPISADVELLSQ